MDKSLYRLWCSFPECIRYAKYEVGIDGPLVCGKHAREIRLQQRASHMAKLVSR